MPIQTDPPGPWQAPQLLEKANQEFVDMLEKANQEFVANLLAFQREAQSDARKRGRWMLVLAGASGLSAVVSLGVALWVILG